ncbi:MAG: hypothetical protein E7049_02885 [Lentisphaerae bacterium]|nr:hypothetical protein [Lentisphaerota bacterium]
MKHTIQDRFVSARACLFAAFSLAVSVAFAAPGKPENVAATTDRTDGIRLTWNAVDGASYYVVYRYGGKTAQTGLVQQRVTARNWLDTTCEAGANITYRVRAFDSSDEGGAYSAYVRGYRKVLLEPYVGGNVSVNPLANGGAGQPLKVRCNVDWTAKASDWIHLNSGSYERSNEATELGFSLEPNTTGAAREGTITVYAGQESKTLTVIQGAVEVPEYDTWCGDSALAIIEDAAFPEEFLFRTEYTGGFLSYSDETAVGGSCLRSSPMDIGGSAVISWTMPSAWKLRFRWRKDSSKSSDSLRLYAGSFDSSGKPNLASATILATCSSTEWTYTEVSSQSASGAQALFFVYEKKSGGTSGTASGFGFIDDFLLMTAPREISFARPVRLDGNGYSLNLPCDSSLSVATEVTFSHMLTYGGATRSAKGYVYPTWRKVTSDSFLSYGPGSGEDAKNTVFSSRITSSPRTVEIEATYEVAGVSVSELLTVNITPPALDALDLESGAAAVVNAPDWLWTEDDSAENGSCVSCPVPGSGDSRSFSICFSWTNRYYYTPQNLFSFNYRLQSLGSGEAVVCTVDGSPAMVLPATGDTDWHRMTIYIPDSTQNHEVTWTYSKSGSGTVGSGVSIDFAKIEELPTSLVVDNKVQTIRIADYAVSEGYCGMSVEKGADWMSAATPWVSGGSGSVQLSFPLEFSITANGTGNPRGGKLKLGGVDDYLDLYVVQSSTADTTVSDLSVQPQMGISGYYANVTEGDETQFTASFTLGGQEVEGFTDLEWFHGFGETATLEDGLLTVATSDRSALESIGFRLGDAQAWLQVLAHPPLSLVVPDGLEFTADGWWVEDGYSTSSGEQLEEMPYLKSALWAAIGSEQTLTATVTGPALFKCEGRGMHTTGFYLDGERNGGTGGSDWSEAFVGIPDGEHELSIVYEKQNSAGAYADRGEIRNISLTPLVFDGFELKGPAAVTSGSRNTFTLFKRFKDPDSDYTVDFEVPITEESFADFSMSAGDSRTVGTLSAKLYYEKEIIVRVPLAVQWADTITLSLPVDIGGRVYTATCQMAVTPESLSGLLDSRIAEMTLPYAYNSDVTECYAYDDESAVGGRCVRFEVSDWYSPGTVAVKVLDAGSLSFDYKVWNGSEITVVVDDVDAEYRSATAGDWTKGTVQISGAGPHVVLIQLKPQDYYSRDGVGQLDNVQWSQGVSYSRIRSGNLTGPTDAGLNSYIEYTFSLSGIVSDGAGGTSSQTWDVEPDRWEVQFVSGDPDALSSGYGYGNYRQFQISDTVTADSVFNVIACYAIGGSSYDAKCMVSVPSRTTVEAAIFDSGTYDNCVYGWGNGWNGSFDDYTAGGSSAKSSTPSEGSSAQFSIDVFGKGTLEFDWKVSCASGDALNFYRDAYGEGSVTTHITGTGGTWQHVAITFNDEFNENGRPISRTCRWSFAKNTSASAGSNCGWVDNITWSGTTKLPISYAEVKVKYSLAPGETAPVTVDFYRDSGQQSDPTPATGDDIPPIDSMSISYVSEEALEPFLSLYNDGSGNYYVSVSPDCDVSGYFSIVANYTLYGQSEEAYGYPDVDKDATAPVTLLGAASPSGGRLLTAMAANGVNTVGECYTAGLDPDDPDAKLTTYVTISNGVPYITWSPNLPDRTYIIQGKASLSDPQWTTPTNSTHRFFRVEVKSDK